MPFLRAKTAIYDHAWPERKDITYQKDRAARPQLRSFHSKGIEIAFPQRDLYIKSAVPLQILKDNSQPVAKNSLEITGNR